MPTPPAAPTRPLRGDRALAVRIIGETGARAAIRPAARPTQTPAPRSRSRIDRLLDRVPRDVVRRGLRRIDRLVVRRAGGAILALRRTDDPHPGRDGS